MKNLVTGATGFIGSHIAEKLVKRGEKVRVLARKTSNVKFLKSLGVEIVYGDLTDAQSIRQAVKGMDKIFHSAAIVGDWVPRETAYNVNVGGTKKVLEAANGEKVKRFIYVSSLAVLGMRDHHKTPSNPPANLTGDVYADTKIDSEKLVVSYCTDNKIPFSVIRPGFVFGPRDAKVIPGMVNYIKNGRFIFVGSGLNKVNMIYVENLANAVVDASYSAKSLNQVYNVTNDSGMTMMDVVNMVSDMWGFNRPKKHIPKQVAYTLCSILEFFARLTRAKKPPLLNKTRLKFLSLNLDFDIGKIRQELGYTPQVDMKEGLRRTKAWLETENKV